MDPLEELRRKFPGKPDSWLKRALARVADVSEAGGYYVVKGRPELGDRYPLYHVWWNEAERRWTCTCYLSEWGQARARGICTHVAAVMLYRSHRRAASSGGWTAYVARAEVECGGRPEAAEGEIYARPAAGGRIIDYVKPKWKILAISRRPEIVVTCNGRVALRVRGEAMSYASARVLAEEFEHDEKS